MRKNEKLINRLYMFLDLFLIVICYSGSYYLRFFVLQKYSMFQLGENERYYPFFVYIKYLWAMIPAFLVSFSICGVYKQRARSSRQKEMFLLFTGGMLSILIYIAYLFWTKEIDISRGFLGIFFSSIKSNNFL